MTAERAVKRDKVSDRHTPLGFKEFPKDEKVFSSSWQPADDKLFPQCHLSDESTTKLLKGIGRSDFKKPDEVEVTESVIVVTIFCRCNFVCSSYFVRFSTLIQWPSLHNIRR